MDNIKFEQIDNVTGEITTLTAQAVTIVKPKKYRFEGDGSHQPNGDMEVNNGEYLVDETGYVPLETLFKRSLEQGTFNPFAYEGVDVSDDSQLDFDDDISPEEPELPSSEGSSSSEVSGEQQSSNDVNVVSSNSAQ